MTIEEFIERSCIENYAVHIRNLNGDTIFIGEKNDFLGSAWRKIPVESVNWESYALRGWDNVLTCRVSIY